MISTRTAAVALVSRAFIDTNVLVYAVDEDEPRKRELAMATLSAAAGRLVISAQVLAEFYVTVTRKLGRPLPPAQAASRVTELAVLPLVALDEALVRSAIAISREQHLSYWDAAIVAAAVVGGCDRVLTEDLHHGACIAGVRIENPFLGAPASADI